MPKKDRQGVIKRSDSVGEQAVRLYARVLDMRRRHQDSTEVEHELDRVVGIMPWMPPLMRVSLTGTPTPARLCSDAPP
jgi:hypothetical protein